jgi:tetratricopeptide (TPR) repeat protein
MSLESQGHFDKAISDFTEAIQRRSNYAKAYFHRSAAREKTGDLLGAISDSNEVMRIVPSAYKKRVEQ